MEINFGCISIISNKAIVNVIIIFKDHIVRAYLNEKYLNQLQQFITQYIY